MTVAPVETLAAAAFDTSKPFVSSIDERDLVYFVLNVGDGDTQLILLPASPTGRRALVIDCATSRKLPALIAELGDAGLQHSRRPGNRSSNLSSRATRMRIISAGCLSFWTCSATTSASSGSRVISTPQRRIWR